MGRPRKNPVKNPVESVSAEAPKFDLTPEEIQAVLRAREQIALQQVTPTSTSNQIGMTELAQALTQALIAVQPPRKKTVADRVKRNPWTPTDGSPKILTLKRPMYHHGIPLNPKRLTNEVCKLLDKIKPGPYMGGWVRVTRRKDNGLDIDYPIRTPAQRLKLSSQFGITSFQGFLERLIAEREDPKKYAQPGDDLDE